MEKPDLRLRLAALAARWLPGSAKQALYRIKPLAHAIRAGLNTAAPAGLVEVQVAAGNLAGMCLRLDLHNEKDYWLGTYEPELQAAIQDLIQPGMVVFDVGANIGYISLQLAKAAGERGKVYAFEALPANLNRLEQNLALNENGRRVTIIPGAAAEKSGKVLFWIGPSNGMGKIAGSAGRRDVDYGESIEVESFALDDFVFRQGYPAPQAIKMDIEGGEVLALKGMQRISREAHPLILLELHGPESAGVAWELLTGAGYQLSWMKTGYPPIHNRGELDWKAYILAR